MEQNLTITKHVYVGGKWQRKACTKAKVDLESLYGRETGNLEKLMRKEAQELLKTTWWQDFFFGKQYTKIKVFASTPGRGVKISTIYNVQGGEDKKLELVNFKMKKKQAA